MRVWREKDQLEQHFVEGKTCRSFSGIKRAGAVGCDSSIVCEDLRNQLSLPVLQGKLIGNGIEVLLYAQDICRYVER